MVSRELSFDDLSAPLAEAAPLGGPGPFVINLGASSAPMELPAEDLTSGSQAYVYRIRRNEDGRIRYRLRLGPFVREEDADAALSKVRNVYPSALTATAWVEDLNAIAVQQAKAGSTRPVLEAVPKLRAVSSAPQIPTLEGPVAEPTPVEADVAGEEIVLAESELHSESIDLDDGEPTIEAPALTELALAAEEAASSPMPTSASPTSRGAADDAPTQSMPAPALEFPELLLLDDGPAPVPQSRPLEGTMASPAATGKLPVLEASFDALSSSLSLAEPLSDEVPAAVTVPVAMAVQTPVNQPAKPAAAMPPRPVQSVPIQTVTKPAAASPVAAARPAAPEPARRAEPARETPLSLETTQTLRPLTSSEMQNEVALRWFVIQLSLSEQAFDPSAVPNLDIFLLYRLYSVASVDQGRPVHALRLGFFGEEMAAQAVASYLKSYYENPTVKRVSVAERERFSEHRLDARKDVGETGQHAAIELSTDRPAAKVELPPAKPAQMAMAQPTAAVRAAALRQIAGQQPKKEKPAGVFASLPWIGRRK